MRARLGHTVGAIVKNVLCFRGLRNREEKSAAATHYAFDPYASTVSFDDAFGDRQSESSAEASCPYGRLPESVKDVRQAFRRDAATSVRNPEEDLRVF